MDTREPMALDLESMRRKFTKWKEDDTGRPPVQGVFFEGYIWYMQECLLTGSANDVRVTRDARVTGTMGSEYRIDVLYEFTFAGLRHRVAIECKDTKRPIDRDEVMAFSMKLQDLPGTIGVFISRNGYQSGAAKYLDDRGIERLDGTQVPHFGALVGSRMSAVALPSDRAIGEPFWGIMHYPNGRIDGTWCLVPADPAKDGDWGDAARCSCLPLFYSRRQAKAFCRAYYTENAAVVRGIKQPTLRMMTSIASDEGRRFAIVEPLELEGRVRWSVSEIPVEDLVRDYLV